MSRDINKLAPDVRALCVLLIDQARIAGIKIGITSTLRTPQEQEALYALGRMPVEAVNALRGAAGMPSITEEENNRRVTWTRQSRHLTGRAFDFVVIHPRGYADWHNIEAFTRVGEIGEALGLYWGGRFEKRDLAHFQAEPPE